MRTISGRRFELFSDKRFFIQHTKVNNFFISSSVVTFARQISLRFPETMTLSTLIEFCIIYAGFWKKIQQPANCATPPKFGKLCVRRFKVASTSRTRPGMLISILFSERKTIFFWPSRSCKHCDSRPAEFRANRRFFQKNFRRNRTKSNGSSLNNENGTDLITRTFPGPRSRKKD